MSADPLDILLLAPPFEARGICAYTVRLARGLARLGVQTQILTSAARHLDPRIRDELPVHEWLYAHLPVWGSVLARLRSKQLFERLPQLIHIQSPRMLRLGNELARTLQVPYVLTVHHLSDGPRLAIDRRWCQRVIAASESVADELVNRGRIPASLVTVIAPGVEACDAEQLSPPLETGRAPVIGTAGPLELDKGLCWFLGSARAIHAVRPEVEFVIAGSGSEETNLRRLARELGITSQVTFAPYLYDFQISLRAMDIFCLPAVRKGLSAIMLEAMVLGVPVVATSLGGIDDVIDNQQTGILVPPQDMAGMTDRLLWLLNNPLEARRLGAAGRERVLRDYGVDQMVSRTLAVYQAIAADPRRVAA